MTLAAAHYRWREYKEAIDASKKSRDNGSESPINLAIIALSYSKLGDKERAAEFRVKWESAVSEVIEKTADIKQFASEVKKAFP